MSADTCPACNGQGDWETECCSGASGCPCGGRPMYMGRCNACDGTGRDQGDSLANVHSLSGVLYPGRVWPERTR